MDAYELISRNAEELVTEAEVRELAEDPEGKRAYVGYEPSGVLHIGHMLTANKLIDLQEAGFEVVILLADVHAYLNDKGSFEEIRETAERMKEQFIAYGLDEENTEFRFGSEFQMDDDYVLDLHALELETTLNRASRAMSEIQSGESTKVSQAVYPLMQSLDIEYLDLDLAIGGMEQRKVHMLARDTLPSIGYESPTCLHTPLIAELSSGEGKMSSSKGVTISMEDSTEDIEEKVNGAFCPPTRDPDGDLENPVLQIFEYHVFPRFENVVVERPDKYGGNLEYDDYESLEDDLESGELHPADAKSALATYLDELIAPGREKLRQAE
ncbi:tyrosyl-tRNA synthetase [Haladaptatus paucihalophilus DX253]|uniref:Tyrosine--tRNA ligase n=1 Tax=Haladaptatus paucihalophilus DX253 TaxID=797209 RepID=E7QN95_HALPU|nr:tyrosine--tRNA ligase [Haladaptatus paucihalophilus]EFW93890.1 tyrosyl-tRNA synthetase [Haladaptatus paucihalophilus DX253]SHK67707.1 tyrosyl-tRNA synthetase [Haladaptatus paucihalophilus DX253]